MSRQKFVKQSEIPASVEEVFALHLDPSVVKLLTPPWEKVEFLQIAESLRPGTRTIIKVYFGPFPRNWVAEHTEYVPDQFFADVQLSGPFAYWYHRHLFERTERGTTLYTDEVEYELPLGLLGKIAGGKLTRARLERMFDYRHRIVAEEMKKRSKQLVTDA